MEGQRRDCCVRLGTSPAPPRSARLSHRPQVEWTGVLRLLPFSESVEFAPVDEKESWTMNFQPGFSHAVYMAARPAE